MLWPEDTPRLVLRADGAWDVPSRALTALHLGPATRYTRLWVKLELRGGPAPLNIVLLADQLDAAGWSRLQAELRSPSRRRDLTGLSSRST